MRPKPAATLGAMRLGIDLDGVVADFNAGWMERYNRHFAGALTPDQVVHWDGLVPITHFTDMDEFWAWAQEGTSSIFRELPCYDGACDTLAGLAHDHDVVVISSKYDWAIPDTLEWLAEHRFPTREIHFTWNKPSVDCDVYLEDAPHNLERLVRERPQATVCRFVRPWNSPLDGTIDVRDWPEFAAVVTELATVPQ